MRTWQEIPWVTTQLKDRGDRKQTDRARWWYTDRWRKADMTADGLMNPNFGEKRLTIIGTHSIKDRKDYDTEVESRWEREERREERREWREREREREREKREEKR
jgi:hypothetical protein